MKFVFESNLMVKVVSTFRNLTIFMFSLKIFALSNFIIKAYSQRENFISNQYIRDGQNKTESVVRL